MCTGIQIKTTSGAPIYARTLEFSSPLDSAVLVIPAGHLFKAIDIDGNPTAVTQRKTQRGITITTGVTALAWISKYAITGINGMAREIITDGINSEGLAVGSFYHNGYAEYMDLSSADLKFSLSSVDVPNWLLSNCTTVAEVKTYIKTLKINKGAPKVNGQQGITYPLHYNIHDAQGNALVIECIKGELKIYDNPKGVLTNNPTFDWHQTNLRNYVNLSPVDKSVNTTDMATSTKKDTITALGLGSGLLGLPGDFTPPSRFIRAVAFTQSVLPFEEPIDAVTQAFHILSSFDIPKGVSRSGGIDKEGKPICDTTLWTSAADLKNKIYYFHSRNNRTVRMVDLKNWDFRKTPTIQSYDIIDQQEVVQINSTSTPAPLN